MHINRNNFECETRFGNAMISTDEEKKAIHQQFSINHL